jgi:hypothetical protein
LTTVTEELELGRKNFRCRLEMFWPLWCKLLFGTVLATEMLVLILFAEQLPWLWLLPITLPLLYWFIAEQGHDFQSATAALMDDNAQHLGLVKVPDPH